MSRPSSHFSNLTEKRLDLVRTLRIDFTVTADHVGPPQRPLKHAPEVGRPIDLVDLEIDPLGYAVGASEVVLDLAEQRGLAELPPAVDEAGAERIHDCPRSSLRP